MALVDLHLSLESAASFVPGAAFEVGFATMSEMAVERASCSFVAVDVLVDRLVPHRFQRLIGEPVADLLGALRVIEDLGLDDASGLLIDAASISLPGLGSLLARHETCGPGSHCCTPAFAAHSPWGLAADGGAFLLCHAIRSS